MLQTVKNIVSSECGGNLSVPSDSDGGIIVGGSGSNG